MRRCSSGCWRRVGGGVGGGAAGGICRGGADRVAAGPAGQRGHLTPTVVSSLDRARLDGLDTLIVGGEALPGELVAAWAPGRQMFNVLRPHRDHHLGHLCTAVGGAAGEHRRPDRRGVRAGAGCAAEPGAHRGGRRVVSGRACVGARLFGPGGVDRGTVRGQPLRGAPGRACTAPATWCAGPPLGPWSIWAAPIPRSNCADSASNWAKSKTPCWLARRSPRRPPPCTTSDTGAHLVAYITLEHTSTADHDAEIVEEWQHLYDELYDAEVAVSGFGMDFRGWNSSYTGDPIPLEEMVEWRSATVDRIMALQPRRVLEIGAGSGLVLSQIAPRCEHYVGTDISAVAIDTLARSLEQLRIGWRDRVQLLSQPAHVTEALPQGYFDTIILNSVIQYFPNGGYLAEVIDNAMELLAPGGALFIGDVRNHSLQGAFQTAVALARTDATDAAEIRQRVQRAVLGEPELLLAPEVFTTWAGDHASGGWT